MKINSKSTTNLIICSIFILVIGLFLGMSLGTTQIGISQILKSIFSRSEDLEFILIRDVRLPRVLSVLLTGGILGVTGAMIQGVTRNPIAGLMADVINRKKIMVYLDFFTSGLLVIYALIIFSGQDNIMIVASVMFILSIIYTLYSPAVSASIPQIVEKEELASANGIVQQVGYVANLLGPILAGVLYSLIGIRIVVVINAVCFFISALMELFLDIPDIAERKKFKNPFLDSFTEMKRAFIYLKEEKKVVLGIICFYGLTNIFVVPVTTIITPYFINIVLAMPPEIYGFIEAIFVSGMIIGGLLITFKPKWFNMKTIHKTMYPMTDTQFCQHTNQSLNYSNFSFGDIAMERYYSDSLILIFEFFYHYILTTFRHVLS